MSREDVVTTLSELRFGGNEKKGTRVEIRSGKGFG